MYDAVVVGLGGVGSFALRALSKGKSGGRFLGVERFSRGHVRGSSHGKTRIYRRAYFEHPNYVPWIEYSLSIFRELEQAMNVSIMQQCGTLLMQPAESRQQQMPPLLQASWNSAQEHGIPVEFLNPADLYERYPQFQSENTTTSPREQMVGLLEPGGGFLRPELAQEAALQHAQASGSVSILENTKVLGFEEISGSTGSTWIELLMQTDGESEPQVISTKRLLISMGAWTGQLLPSWATHLRVTRQLQGWVDVASLDTDLFSYQRMPTWVMDKPALSKPLYGVPCDDHAGDEQTRHWLKMGIHGRDNVVEDPATNPTLVSEQEYEELFTHRHMHLIQNYGRNNQTKK